MAVFGDFCPKTPEMHFSQIPVFDKSNKFFIHRDLCLNIKSETSKLDKLLLFQLWMKVYYAKKKQNNFWRPHSVVLDLVLVWWTPSIGRKVGILHHV